MLQGEAGGERGWSVFSDRVVVLGDCHCSLVSDGDVVIVQRVGDVLRVGECSSFVDQFRRR